MEILGIFGTGIFILSIIALAICAFIFWVVMIIDCAGREFKNPNDKIVWILILVFLHVLGALIYWVVVKKSSSSSA